MSGVLYISTLKWASTFGSNYLSISPATFCINADSSHLTPPPRYRLSPMPADLPPEVWRIIFGYLTTKIVPINHSELSAEALWKSSTFPDPHTARDFPILPQFMGRAILCRLWKPEFKPSSEALVAVQVCRAWYDLGLEFLYHTIVFSTKSHFDILSRTLAPPNDWGRFVRRVRIGCSVQVSPDDLQPVLNYCPNIEDFEAHEMYPSRRLFPSLANQSNIRHGFFSSRDSSPLFGAIPTNLSTFTNLRTLHIVVVALLEQLPAMLPQLAVLVLKCEDGSSSYYQHVAKWTLPSLRVLVCQWINSACLHALCKAFAQTVEVLEVIQYDSWRITSATLEMPMLKHLVVDWIPPFPGYTPRFNLLRHFHSLPSLTAVHIDNLDRALEHTRAVTVAAEVEDELVMLNPLAPQLQTLYVGARIGDVEGSALERCFTTRLMVVGWALRGRDGIWKVAGDGQLMLEEPVTA